MKGFVSLCLALILATTAVGIYGRTTHEDIIRYSDGVLDLSGHTAVVGAGFLSDLPDDRIDEETAGFCKQPMIARVRPTGRAEQRRNRTVTEVVIEEVYRGDESLQGSRVVYLSRAFFETDVTGADIELYEGLSVNLMRREREYVVAMDDWPKPKGWKEDGNRYFHTSSPIMFPYFCVEDLPNRLPASYYADSGLPYYEELKDNEIFASNKTVLSRFQAFKQSIFDLYGVTLS